MTAAFDSSSAADKLQKAVMLVRAASAWRSTGLSALPVGGMGETGGDTLTFCGTGDMFVMLLGGAAPGACGPGAVEEFAPTAGGGDEGVLISGSAGGSRKLHGARNTELVLRKVCGQLLSLCCVRGMASKPGGGGSGPALEKSPLGSA